MEREDGGVSGVSSSCGARGGFLPRHDEDLREPLVRRLVGQLDADECQQAVERLVVLTYVRFLLTAQVDVSVELLGVLEKWVRVGARPQWMGTGRARDMEEQSEAGDTHTSRITSTACITSFSSPSNPMRLQLSPHFTDKRTKAPRG